MNKTATTIDELIDTLSTIPANVQRLALAIAFNDGDPHPHPEDIKRAEDRVATILATCKQYGASINDIINLADKCWGVNR